MTKTVFKNYLEIITNTAVVIVILVLAGVFGWKWIYPTKNKMSNPFIKGNLFSQLKDLNEESYKKTLVLALNTNCNFCVQSLPFYKNLAESNSQNKNLQIVALFPQSQDEVRKFLGENNLNIKSISNVDYGTLKVPVTPTIILIDSNREILES